MRDFSGFKIRPENDRKIIRKGIEKPSNMEPKTDPKRPQNSGRPRSWSVLAAKTPQDPPKTSPRPPQDRPKTPQDRPRPPPDTPRCPQDAPKTCQRPDQDAPRSHKTPKRRPKTAQEAPKIAQKLPKRAQEASKGAEERDFQGTGGAFEAGEGGGSIHLNVGRKLSHANDPRGSAD